jgi:hypothetical protein
VGWIERVRVERFRKSCPHCSKTLAYNQFIYDLGYRKCLWCSSSIETHLLPIANYFLIIAGLSTLLATNLAWELVGSVCGAAWALRRFRLQRS